MEGFMTILLLMCATVHSMPQPDSVFITRTNQGLMGQVFVYDSRNPRKLYPVCSEAFEQEAADIFCGKYTQNSDVTAIILHGDGITYNNENDDIETSARVVVYSHSVRYLDCFESKTLMQCDFDVVNEYCGRSAGHTNLYAHVLCLNRNISETDLGLKISLDKSETGASDNWGKLIVSHLGIRGEFCTDKLIPDQIANVTCRQLNYTGGAALAVKSRPRSGIDRFRFTAGSLDCNGHERALSDCTQSRGQWPFEAGTEICNNDNNKLISYGAVCYQGQRHNEFELRLRDGPSHWSGRLEMFYNRKWGTFCDLNSKTDRLKPRSGFAETACRLLGYRSGFGVGHSLFGRGTGPILMETRTCNSADTSLLTCTDFASNWNDVTMECRTKRLELGVVCYKNVRLRSHRAVNAISYMRQYGHVEQWVNNEWRSICSRGWDKDDALVTCRELGFRTGSVVPQQYFSSMQDLPVENMLLSGVKCSGYEKSLSECSYDLVKQCDDDSLAFVVCSNDTGENGLSLLLVDTNKTESHRGKIGHLLVTVNNRQGYICPTMWDDTAASAACRSLNYAGGVAVKMDIYPAGSRSYIISDVDCSRSSDAGFRGCDYTDNPPPSCNQYEPAAAHCYTRLHDLFEFSIDNEEKSDEIAAPPYGRVMLTYRGLTGSLASLNIDQSYLNELADSICKQIGGFTTGEIKTTVHSYPNEGPVWMIPKNIKQCRKSNNSAYDALKTCAYYISTDDNYQRAAHQHDVTISCHRNVRLYQSQGLSYKPYGLLQVYETRLAQPGWMPVCLDYTWSSKQLAAVCSILGRPFGALIEQLPHLLATVHTNSSSATDLRCADTECLFKTVERCYQFVFLRCSPSAHFEENPWAPVQIEDKTWKPVLIEYSTMNVSSAGQKSRNCGVVFLTLILILLI
ncbi:scavenger receptor cysteine-rich type 1 protein M130-like [Tubulanus polymorphus]|uniref:scavenger receptor cysteine-rich type 1 protein M130-like n=1 Tax=Tubulanus polymorphus TaxID=672921 RepID=UPI003DA52610